MEFNYENLGTTTYLVYTITPEDQIDTMTLGMLTNNKIPGLASTVYTQIDAQHLIKYNISSKVPVSQFFYGLVNKKRLLSVFQGITEALLSAEDYMIDASSILLDMDYIFTDVSTFETVLVCLPLASEKGQVNLGAFFKTIMFGTQFDQSENCEYVAKIINYLNSTPTFSLVDFQAVLRSCSSENVKQEQSRQAVASVQKQQPQKTQPTVFDQKEKVTPDRRIEAEPKANPQPVVQKPFIQPSVQKQPISVPAPNERVTPPQQDKGEKGMSFLYLMRHYSKENAEIYKRQKEAAKASEKQGKETSKQKKEKKAVKQAEPQTSFAVPGMQHTVIEVPKTQRYEKAETSSASVRKPQAELPVEQTIIPSQVQPTAPTGSRADFGNTTVLNAGMARGETVVLNAVNSASELKPYLIRKKNNEKILINKPVYRIGKEKSYVDFFIGDNSAISRSHANIISRDGVYFIVDTNSTNHTYVNGEMIPSNTEARLENGSSVRLANEEFEFRLM